MIKQVKKVHSRIPLIIKRICISAGAISLALGSYGLISNDNFFIKTGGICLMISVGLPPLVGINIKKDESTN